MSDKFWIENVSEVLHTTCLIIFSIVHYVHEWNFTISGFEAVVIRLSY